MPAGYTAVRLSARTTTNPGRDAGLAGSFDEKQKEDRIPLRPVQGQAAPLARAQRIT